MIARFEMYSHMGYIFERLDEFWCRFLVYNKDNTRIVDAFAYTLLFNVRRCCIVKPTLDKDERHVFLSKILYPILQTWLVSPHRYCYSDTISRAQPLAEHSLKVFHKLIKN